MKKLSILFMLLWIGCKSQEPPKVIEKSAPDTASHRTKIAMALSKRGVILQKDFYNQGTIMGKYPGSGILVGGVIITIGSDKKETLKGIRLIAEEARTGYGTSGESSTVFLDSEDVAGFSMGLSYLTSRAKEMASSPREYTETEYQDQDQFTVGFYQKGNEQQGWVSVGDFSKRECFLSSVDDFVRLKQLVDSAAMNLQHPVMRPSETH